MTKKWIGRPPTECDICGQNLDETDYFVDGRLFGVTSWAIMCPKCFERYGLGLGTGRGQVYDTETLEKLEG